MTKEKNKASKLKLLLSFNGDARIISVDRSITFSELKSKINTLVSKDVVSEKYLKFSYTRNFVEKEKEVRLGYIESDDDVRMMIRGFELLQGICKSCKLCVFACEEKNDECLKRCCDYGNWGFSANCEKLGGNLMTQLSKSEKDWNFVDDSLKRFCESELKILENELEEFDCSNDGFEENGVDFVSGNECYDGRVIDLGDSLLNCGRYDQGSLILDREDCTISESSQGMKVVESTVCNGVDEEHSKSGRNSFAASDSSLGFNVEKENKSREGIHSRHQSGLSINRKDEDVCANSNAYNRMFADVASYYNHLESIELQTIKYSDLEFVKRLGEGAYGIVYYGRNKGIDVAIKTLKLNCSTEGTPDEDKLVNDFWKEAHILGKLHHPNIVALHGVVADGPPKYLAAVTEYMVNGSLKQVLRKRDRTIDRRKRVIIARDAALGMEYLHENNIVHFDLKSHNLLLNMRDPQRPVCKIGDLGLSKIKKSALISGGFRGTLPWMAPELFDAKSMVTEKVDVYSFGIVMWELLTGETPYANMRSKEILAGMIEGDLRPEIPSWCDPVWRSLMERCWSSDPVTRPSFSEIVKELRVMATSMNIK